MSVFVAADVAAQLGNDLKQSGSEPALKASPGVLLNYVLSDVHEVQSIAGAELIVFVAVEVAAQLGSDLKQSESEPALKASPGVLLTYVLSDVHEVQSIAGA